MLEYLLIIAAGLLGGMLNAVAGGGSFITLPALIFVGVPPVMANATGTAALLPGYIASAWRFRKDIKFPANLSFKTLSTISILGGSLGATILLFTSEQVFSSLIPWLILIATLLFIIGPRLLPKKQETDNDALAKQTNHNKSKVTVFLVMFFVCAYGGYFNGGLGIILLAALALLGQTNLLSMNGIKNFVSALLTAIAVLVYASGGVIEYNFLVIMGIAAIVGGYVGAALAYRIPQNIMRGFIIAIGLIMSVVFFLR
ncbi:sulfite exporter TauE/SafE family protein [Cocleimonas flava]|uniref:Probable membrane transporter protein n=1 Tax=Cocleimonas flava TaxID=634765 RepID=A0A4R1ES73_9GAMM|nr:sulfite exporter TauE/SafE family protein [Cocleimonas flava]TCJ82752.1 hypothetical protein EV695_3484 [Cocleimonas flava]